MSTKQRDPLPRDAQGRNLIDRLYLARRLTQTDPRLGEWTLDPSFDGPPLEEIVRLANEMGVDPRWLATGKPSPAAAVAVDLLSHSGFHEEDEAIAIVRMTPQPLAPPNPMQVWDGDCRYCGCVNGCACDGGCEWVDDDLTICSACLEDCE